jgi:hypothetical protein
MFIKTAKITATIFIAIWITACASTGNQTLKNETEFSVAEKIVEGVTTSAEVKSMFGSPFETTYTDSGLLIWKYRLDDVKADAVNFIPVVSMFGSSMSGTRKELVILFDENDVVKRANMSESQVKTKTGAFK